MTPEQRIAARLNGVVNRLHRALEPIEWRLRHTRPDTPEDREREERRRAQRSGR
jgi:hypothetical protein